MRGRTMVHTWLRGCSWDCSSKALLYLPYFMERSLILCHTQRRFALVFCSGVTGSGRFYTQGIAMRLSSLGSAP